MANERILEPALEIDQEASARRGVEHFDEPLPGRAERIQDLRREL